MRSTAILLAALALGALPANAHHGIHGPDGVTAEILWAGSVGGVLVQDSFGNYLAEVRIFQKSASGWSQVAMGATMRVFAGDAGCLCEQDAYSRYFTSSASAPALVAIPAAALGSTPRTFDVFVTFSNVPADPATGRVPTSHHNVAKNAAIAQGLFDLADHLDYHAATRVVGA